MLNSIDFIKIITILILFGSISCRREESFPELGLKVANPIDVAVDASGQTFYVLNSDFERNYNKGSILMVDSAGEKIGAVSIPRMARTLEVAGDRMLVGFDRNNDENEPAVRLYDLADPRSPALKKEWRLDRCTPINTVMVADYDQFAVSCLFGGLYVGHFDSNDLSASTLKKVRDYGRTRRALYLDPNRELLLGFTTILGEQDEVGDSPDKDATSFDEQGQEVKAEDGSLIPNEIPDKREETRTAQRNEAARTLYQFFVYDLRKEGDPSANGCTVTETEDCVFPLRSNQDEVVRQENRWIYFKLSDVNGTPDSGGYHDQPDIKYYRTNFWEAQPDPLDANAFYLSHRGVPSRSKHANQIVKVSFAGGQDLRVTDGEVPKTSDVFKFERVYGFSGSELYKLHYPSDFTVSLIQGQKTMLVNHFRDLSTWKHSEIYFSIAAKVLDANGWSAETTNNQDPMQSLYQIAVNGEGKAISGSYYGNKIVLLDIVPGVSLDIVKEIN